MSKNYDNQPITRSYTATDIDEGLRAHMIRVFAYMAMGLGLTGLVSFLTASSPALMNAIFGSPLKWVVVLSPLAIVFFLSARINQMTFSAAQMTFWAYSGLMGLSLSVIFVVFTNESIARLFFITASVFASMSLYGYTTRRDLSSMASFLIMGVWGLVVASLVNLFMQSSAMQIMISMIAVLVFTGLTAYDTQSIKESYLESDSLDTAGKKAIFGALMLYINFISLFIHLLQLFGERK